MTPTTVGILDLLRRSQGYVSGEAMCVQHGISRAAVWKHIGGLRELGYRISSAPRRGYRLDAAPNSPLPTEVLPLLATHRFGRAYHFLRRTDSTNRVAGELAEAGAAEGTTVVADTQTAGRGRLGREWFSPPGVNLYVSIILRPRVQPVRAPQLALVAGLCVVRAVRCLCPGLPLRLKWPNDVYCDRRKLAGVLCDLSADMDEIRHLILGIGVNVNLPPTGFPGGLAGAAVTLQEMAGIEVSRPQLLAGLLAELEQAVELWVDEGLGPLLDEWRHLSILEGREVRVHVLGQELTGTVTGLSREGALRLRTATGKVREVLSGDVTVAEW
ncbi:MAG: biotin--[acetyl-CoA-carboxylase] ligase [Lentisphaerae bacterium RIFOXYB12_FULL_65_16]|nr:MAG: biotin--[acetyl-CoA-carboxylase] ligase [Lentisphaerae bacterium RIFOXYA12_64_32]OGV84515.1 MAG: biotin--[acetyl-CoA-carboxylase] ligase [Lentisphaerae bacterium RIFOXYB12_FULL_65_16]